MKKDYLLEIGCENLPSGYINDAVRQLEKSLKEELNTERVTFDSVYVTGTPNRLLLHVKGLMDKQGTTVETVTGPPVSVAYTPEGGYSKAAHGFAKRQGVGVEELSKVDTDRGEYLAVVKRIKGRPTRAILDKLIPGIICGLKFPKMMKWDDSDFRFARPVRWIMSLYGDKSMKLRIGNLTSSTFTRLSPFFEGFTDVKGIDDYYLVLRKNGIILDHDRRKEKVASLARKEAAGTGGSLVEDERLCDMVANLVESPVAMAGKFDRSFLKLPREVIVTALRSHQRYFSVEDSTGKLNPDFIAFADGAVRNTREIVRGYERVLQARLADAEFYFREDTARPLEEMAEKLEGIVWLEGLGTMRQKTERISVLSEWFLEYLPSGEKSIKKELARAAKLAKADLASEMVKDGKEFTLLQGYIGREYARVSGESEVVAKAIYEHYFPRYSGDRLPETETGILLSLADKLDTITGCFIQGLEPTGSQDPYGLRRGAMGILRILIEKKLQINLGSAIEKSISLFSENDSGTGKTDMRKQAERITDLFEQRFFSILKAGGFDHDLISSILGSPWKVPMKALEMVAKLQGMREAGCLGDFVLAMKRITNILPKTMKGKVTTESGIKALGALAEADGKELGFSDSLFRENAERLLYEAVCEAAKKLSMPDENETAGDSFGILEGLVPVINDYFDDVMVNCEDTALRENRILFLHALHRVFGFFCNYSMIAGE